MPSSYTTSLRLVLPVTGELTGTWGDTVNNGLTQLVEAAIAGTAAVTMTDANYTLSTANEAADEARCMFISLSGGSLTATRDVICPSVSKLYVVLNGTTGGQSIRFKTSAGTGITLANGQRALLYCDGTNVTNAIGLPPLSGTGSNGSALSSLGALGADTQARTGASSVAEADRGDVLFCTNSFTLSLTAAATLGDGFSFGLVNTGTGSITIDPNGGETIDGAATKVLGPDQSALVITDGSNWRTLGLVTAATASETQAGIVELATTAEVQAGVDTSRAVTAAGLKAAQIQLATAVTLTTQTAVDFTGIPAWAKRVTVLFAGVRANGSDVWLVQLGDSGGIEETGYTAVGGAFTSASGVANYSTGFGISNSSGSGAIREGALVLQKINGNTWVATGIFSRSGDAVVLEYAGGSKTLSDVLTQLRFTTTLGGNQFNLGTINVSWE